MIMGAYRALKRNRVLYRINRFKSQPRHAADKQVGNNREREQYKNFCRQKQAEKEPAPIQAFVVGDRFHRQ